ncbi:MAG: Flp pilus assembly complex ATPase component TadA [Clostridiales Family XIII bacterium]|jgi:pilus assembly protein CpaF|nr:Flp pilus assembly complex ATPase component TadA [Clostridiales Family XIII bacterium]
MNEQMAQMIQNVTETIRQQIRTIDDDLSDEAVMLMIEDIVMTMTETDHMPMDEVITIVDSVFFRTRKELGLLQPLIDDETISEVMVNGIDDVFIERAGSIERAEIHFEDTEELEEIIRRIGAKIHREINELNPILDARLLDGSRVNAVYKNVALNGPILTIRKFPRARISMDALFGFGTITKEAAEFLIELVRAGYNIFISGGTSSGKTTFLNVLSNYIPAEERIITIEDSAELCITEVENIVSLECRNSNSQGQGQVNMCDLIKSSLRMRPNRIIVGEVRGAEVLDMIQAMNTGHDGSLSTGHGNSPDGMISRLEAMFLQAADFPIDAIRSQIAEGIDIIVHLSRLADRRRVVFEISEVARLSPSGIELSKLFIFDNEKGLVRTDYELIHTDKLELARHYQ